LLLVTAHVEVCHLAYDISKPYVCVLCLLKFSDATCILLVKELESMLVSVRVIIVWGIIVGMWGE